MVVCKHTKGAEQSPRSQSCFTLTSRMLEVIFERTWVWRKQKKKKKWARNGKWHSCSQTCAFNTIVIYLSKITWDTTCKNILEMLFRYFHYFQNYPFVIELLGQKCFCLLWILIFLNTSPPGDTVFLGDWLQGPTFQTDLASSPTCH